MARPTATNPKAKGFTLVELVIVLVVVGILIVLVLSSISGVKAKAEDTARKKDIDTIARQLEDCFDSTCNGAYPSLNQLTDTAAGGFVANNLPGLPQDSLYDSANNLIQGNLPTTSAQYQYEATPAGCTGIQPSSLCTGFTLRAYQETNTKQPYAKESFNK